ncbi:MAG: hypothetical protein J6M18_06965 [Actinomycetaceae bacterium]|nr:hypothetical protein [Actinomycetaceae bacterium]
MNVENIGITLRFLFAIGTFGCGVMSLFDSRFMYIAILFLVLYGLTRIALYFFYKNKGVKEKSVLEKLVEEQEEQK